MLACSGATSLRITPNTRESVVCQHKSRSIGRTVAHRVQRNPNRPPSAWKAGSSGSTITGATGSSWPMPRTGVRCSYTTRRSKAMAFTPSGRVSASPSRSRKWIRARRRAQSNAWVSDSRPATVHCTGRGLFVSR